jgi:hypothetical protein
MRGSRSNHMRTCSWPRNIVDRIQSKKKSRRRTNEPIAIYVCKWRNQNAVEQAKKCTIMFFHHQKMNYAALYNVRPSCRNGRETAVCSAAVPSVVVVPRTMPTWFVCTIDRQLCVCATIDWSRNRRYHPAVVVVVVGDAVGYTTFVVEKVRVFVCRTGCRSLVQETLWQQERVGCLVWWHFRRYR